MLTDTVLNMLLTDNTTPGAETAHLPTPPLPHQMRVSSRDVDTAPLRLVADAFLRCRQHIVAPFED